MRRILAAVAVVAVGMLAQVEAGSVHRTQKPIKGSYIVILKGDAADTRTTAAAHAAAGRFKLTHVYTRAIKGYAARMTEAAAAALADDPSVALVEEDPEVTASATQSGATWGIDRIDQRDRPLSGTYTYNFDGTGVHAYIIDTGIYAAHPDFAGRVGNGFTAINDGNGTNDCHGHGTHVSGTVGSRTYGVAKNVTLHPVRVLSCTGSGSGSGIIAGIDWVVSNHLNPAVANMSLGGGASSAEDQAVNNAVAAGIVFAVAAGNENTDACTKSPARAASAITVGATTSSDARSSFSNWGTCVDIFGPGSSILSTSNTGGTTTMSGTSMASPHTAGVAALYRQQFPGSSAFTVASAITTASTTGRLTGIGTGSPNRLLYSLFGGSATATPTATARTTPTATPRSTATPRATATARATATPTSGGVPLWQPGVAYSVGALASYQSVTYRCIQAHTSQVGWEPPNTPALWSPQ